MLCSLRPRCSCLFLRSAGQLLFVTSGWRSSVLSLLVCLLVCPYSSTCDSAYWMALRSRNARQRREISTPLARRNYNHRIKLFVDIHVRSGAFMGWLGLILCQGVQDLSSNSSGTLL